MTCFCLRFMYNFYMFDMHGVKVTVDTENDLYYKEIIGTVYKVESESIYVSVNHVKLTTVGLQSGITCSQIIICTESLLTPINYISHLWAVYFHES